MNSHPAALPIDELLKSCAERHVRRSGPGGQNRNKVETGVVLLHLPTGLSAEASERRSQAENKSIAVQRLRRTLATEVRHEIGTTPSPLWKSRVRQRRITVNEGHADFPALLAEALDVLAATDWDTGSAAERLEVSASQLVKLLKSEPRAFKRLNDERANRGLSMLK